MSGSNIIKDTAAFVPNVSGIYQMIDSNNKIIYIGKAKNLKNRIYSYSQNNLSPKTAFMVSLVAKVEWTVTNSEKEALILEADLIRSIKPKFNILLKDDKTYPFIKMSLNDDFPRISNFREKNKTKSKELFGPFASSKETLEFIKIVQKLFLLRTCTNAMFNNRITPCILHQIKRCSAPCVQKISKQDYNNSCKQAIRFLNGNNQELKTLLHNEMTTASKNNNFESAIVFRDKLQQLEKAFQQQSILLNNSENADIIAIIPASTYSNETYFIKLFMLRGGHNYGFVDKILEFKVETPIQEALQHFLIQYYTPINITNNIYINIELDNLGIVKQVLSQTNNLKVNVLLPNNVQKKQLMQIVINNANESLQQHFKVSIKWQEKFNLLQNFFNLPKAITNIEIYDNSHFFGELPLGVMVKAEPFGFNKKDYRIFNVKNLTTKGNDDYAILAEVFTRRFKPSNTTTYPDLIFIDGGKGQLSIAKKILQQYNLTIPLIAIAKGEERNKGQEKLFLNNTVINNIDIPINILHFIQHLRNETHRFAVSSINKRKQKSLTTSFLDNIQGIGKKRKIILINYFTNLPNIQNATMNDISKLPGFTTTLAAKVYEHITKH